MVDVPVVRLSDYEIERCRQIGLLRLRSSANTGRNPARSQDREMAEREWHEQLGCMGELAVAKWLGVPWDGAVNTFHRRPDVAGYDVRAVDRARRKLIFRDNDNPFLPVILVLVLGNRAYLRGWLYGRECVRRQWLEDPHDKRPSWFVPCDALRSMAQLQPQRRLA